MSLSTDNLFTELETLAAYKLRWPGASSEQLEFMRSVYQTNMDRSSATGTFIGDIPEDELEVIEGTHKAKKSTARACKALLASARTAIEKDGAPVKVGVASAYRSASHQFRLWQSYFPNYYKNTVSQREGMQGGAHGKDAIQWMARYVGTRIATPGFSNHQNGVAVDFLNKENGIILKNSTKKPALQMWKESWLWGWLLANASNWHFYQNKHIDEPWHWEYKKPKETTEDWEYTDEEENAILSPPLINPYREFTPTLETIYIKLNIGLSREWGDKAKTIKYNVEPKTGIFIPRHFDARKRADLLIFLHGHKPADLGKDQSIDGLWNAKRYPYFAYRELLNETNRNLILVVPTLGPRSQAGTLTSSEGFSSFVVKVLAAINTHFFRYLEDNSFSMGNIILACHSGGGAPMKRIALLTDKNNYYAGLISECWGFDSLYSSDDADSWIKWAKANPHKSVYQYYIPNSDTAIQGSILKTKAATSGLSNLVVEESSEKRHNWVPAHYFKERLNHVTYPSPESYAEEVECTCSEEGEKHDLWIENSVVFPSGEQLLVVSGAEGPGEEFYDPNQSGNPLLDTSGINRSKQLTKNIQVGELAKSGGTTFDKARIDTELVKCLQSIRDYVGKPVRINSGYRSFAHNEKLRKQKEKEGKKGNVATKSQHMSGRAADIRIEGMSGFDIAKAALDAYSCNIGIGLAPDFAHIDVRGQFAVWRYAGDPASISSQVQQIRDYRAQCAGRSQKASVRVLEEPLITGIFASLADLLRRGYLGLETLQEIVKGERNPERITELMVRDFYSRSYDGNRREDIENGPLWTDIRTRIVQPLFPDSPFTNSTQSMIPRRVQSVAHLHTSWTPEFEKVLQQQYGGFPRKLSSQNAFNDALFEAQNGWDQLDPFILKSMLAQESGFDAGAFNALGFAGISQLGMQEARSVGLSTGASLEQTTQHRRRQEPYLKSYYDFDNDERFDAAKAIAAAAKLLKKKWQSLEQTVYKMYGYPAEDDFYLFVLGAYNGGEGTVKKRVERIYGKQKPGNIRFEDLGTGEWIRYAQVIVGRARQ